MTAPFSVSPAKPQILKKVCGFSFCPKAERRRRPMYFTSGSDRAFEQLMQGKPGFDHYDSGEAVTPEDCGTCRFYRPHWKYQFCVYAECPYQPGKLTAYDAVTFRVKGVENMAVFRVERNKGYTVMSNHHLRNKDLSLKAKGLLSQMLSLPENWDYTRHPRYKYLSDADKKNYFDVDRYLTALRRKRQRVVSQEETFDLYDIDLSDEDMATVDEWLAAFPINKSYQTEIMEVNLWHFSIAQLLLCRPSLWASAVPCVFGAASTFWKVTGRITRPAMLMCHKVTHKNLIDNHLLFRTKEPLMTV